MIDENLRHQRTLLAQMEVTGANSKLAVTPAMRLQERLAKETTLFRKATMRVHYMSINHAHVQTATKRLVRITSSEGACSIECPMLKRLNWDLDDHDRQTQAVSKQLDVKVSHVDTESDHAGCALAKKESEESCIHIWKLDAEHTKFDYGRVARELIAH